MNPLGRREPSDWKHVDRYSLTPATTPTTPVPVVLGINWYVELDNPAKYGNTWWVARNSTLTTVRGGHCVCLEPHGMLDSPANWHWFDQVSEGICVSEGWSRCMALLNRKRYQPRPLYDKAQTVDEYDDTPPEEGTSVRAGGDVARTIGMWPAKQGEEHWYEEARVDRTRTPVAADGVRANRWARNAQEVLTALGTPDRDWVTILNSWGSTYPHRVRMPATVLDRLIRENGEAAIPTDR